MLNWCKNQFYLLFNTGANISQQAYALCHFNDIFT